MLTKLFGGLAIASGLIIAGVVGTSASTTSDAVCPAKAKDCAQKECCEKECCEKECCETQCCAEEGRDCDKAAIAGKCGSQKSQTSKNECCSADCCEGCPDCDCDCPCCENCAEGCECPNMS